MKHTVRNAQAVLLAAMLSLPYGLSAGQSPAVRAPSQPASPAPPPPAVASLSASLEPALVQVRQTLNSLDLNRWRKGPLRDESTDHISQIMNDLQNTLPSLLQTADAAPASIGKALPVSRNIDAVYDVLLRVSEAARVAAPDKQALQLQQALIALEDARRNFDNRLQGAADEQENQIHGLQSTLRAQAAARADFKPAPAPPPCVKPAPAHRPVRRRKPTEKKPEEKKPATTTTTNPPAKQG